MLSFEINAQRRSEFGKGAIRRLRRKGFVPAIIYVFFFFKQKTAYEIEW